MELIRIGVANIGGESVQCVDARELHALLGVSRDFNTWIREQVERARLVLGRDYLTYEDVVQLPSGAKRKKECTLTADAAKHVAMLSQCDMGFRVRDYFIEAEKSLRSSSIAPISLPTYAEALRQLADKVDENDRQAQALAIAAPKVAFVEKYVEAETGALGFREVAKLLKANEAEFRAFLIDESVMYRLAGKLTPMAAHIDAGRFVIKTGAADNGHAFTAAKFTAKGVQWIAAKWAVHQLGHPA